MRATLLSEDGEVRLARLAWRELRRYIAKYSQLELTRASEIAKYLRELGRDNERDAIERLFRFARRNAYFDEDRISEAGKRSGKLRLGMMLRLGPRRKLR
jgi:hypothetical protein